MILNFLVHTWADILVGSFLFLFSVIPIFPPTFAGLNKEYYDTFFKAWRKQKNFNFWELIVHLISHVLVTGPALSLGFRGTVTLALFVVLGADLYLNKRITDNAVIIAIAGIVALYLETFLNTAEEITIWKVFTWKSKKNEAPQVTPPDAQDETES